MVRLSPRSFRVVAEHEQVKKLSSVPAPTDHVGAMLNEARQSIGYDLSQVSHALCIRTLYLQAIEEGRYADLPGPTYAVGFVRTYADYLGLDSDALVARFKSEIAAAPDGKLPLAFPETRPDRPFPSVAIAALSIALVAGVFAGWVYLRETPPSVTVAIAPPPEVTEIPTRTQPAPLPARVRTSVGGLEIPITTAAGDPPTAQIALPTTDAATAIEPIATAPAAVAIIAPATSPLPSAPIVPVDAQLAAPAPIPVVPQAPSIASAAPADIPEITVPKASPRPSATAAIAAEATDETIAAPVVPLEDTVVALPAVPAVPAGTAAAGGAGREYGAANRDARIILTAVAESWVQIRDARENVVLTRMLQPGDTYRVPNRDDLTLLTGNAGGLEISVDGATIPPLGPTGAVRRDIALTPVQLLDN